MHGGEDLMTPWGIVLPIIALISGLCVFILRLMFRAELAEFQGKLFAEMDKKYADHRSVEEPFAAAAEERRQTRHALRNEMMVYIDKVMREAREARG
jgi:hypothetical protein